MKLNRYGIIFGFLTAFLLLTGAGEVWGQTPGQIYKSATGVKPSGQLVLDPNGDGFVSATTAGFTMLVDDVPQFEIPFRALPVISDEPIGDVRTGASGGHTELVDGYADQGVFMYADDFGMYFRMRIAGNSTASKGYTFLINTEDKFDDFGKTVVNGNPGFQFEVTLQTGGGKAGINIYDWRDNSGSEHLLEPLSLSDHHQRAISGSTLDATLETQYGYFYDWYVPWSALTAFMTPTTEFRAAAATVTSANSGLSGSISDVNGINDLNYSSPLAALIAAVESFPPTSPSSLENNEFPPVVVKTKTPVVLGPLLVGDTEVSGTISEPAGTTIEVFVNDVSVETTTSNADFTWTKTGIAALELGDEITARAINTADSKTLSDVSNSIFVGAPGEPVLACLANNPTSNFNVTAFGANSWTISGTTTGIFNDPDIGVLVFIAGTNTIGEIRLSNNNFDRFMIFTRADLIFPSSNDNWSMTRANLTANNGQVPSGNSYEAVAYRISTGTAENLCVGARSNVINSSLTAPVISGSYTEDNTSVTGTATAGTNVALYQNGIFLGTTLITDGTWTYTALDLIENDQLYAIAIDGAGLSSARSNTVTVTAGTVPEPPPPLQTTAPTIINEYIAGSGLTVSGFSTEEAGTIIRLYDDESTLLGTAIVGLTGNWQVTGLTLTTGMVLSATAEGPGKTVSGFSNEKYVAAGLPPAPVLNNNTATIQAGSTSIPVSNTAVTRRLYVDGEFLVSTSGTTFSLTTDQANEYILVGVQLTATAVDANGVEGPISNLVTVVPRSARELTIFASPVEPVAGSSSFVVASLTDDLGNYISGENVTLTRTAGGGSFSNVTPNVTTSGPTATNFLGQVSANYHTLSTPLQLSTIQASHAATDPESANIQTIAGAPAAITLTGPASVVAGETSGDFTIQVVDANGHPTNVTANTTFSITSEQSTTATITSTPVTVTAGSSSATFTYANTVVGDGTHTVTATVQADPTDAGLAGDSDTHDITVTAAAAAKYLLSSSTSSPVAGATVTITAQLADQYDNPVSTEDVSVAWTKSDSNGSFVSTPTLTNASGQATVEFTSHTVAGTSTTVTATSGGPITGTSGTITTTAGAPASITLTGPASVEAGATSTNFTLQVVDVNGNSTNVTANTTFALSSEEDDTATFSADPVMVNEGQSSVTFTYSNTKVGDGTHTVTATVQADPTDVGLANDTATHNITVTAGAATQFVVTLPGQTFSAGSGNSGTPTDRTAGGQFTVQLRAVDAYNNPDPSYDGAKTIVWTGPSAAPDGTDPLYTTSISFTDGVATTTLNTTLYKAETGITLTATQTGGEALVGESAEFDVLAGTTYQLLVADISNPQLRNIPFDVTVTLTDAYENPVVNTGASATITLSGSGGAIAGDLRRAGVPLVEANPTETLGIGASSVVFSDVLYTGLSAEAGDDVQLSALAVGASALADDATGLSNLFSVRGILLTVVADPTQITANGSSTSAVTVTLTDADSNPLQGVTVTVSTDAGTLFNGLTELSGATGIETDANGQIALTLRSTTTAQTATILAQCPGACPAEETVEFVAGTATTIAKYDAGNTDNQSATVGTAVTNDPAVIVTDANGNPVAGVAVSFAVASGGGTVDPVTSVNTNAQGIATVTSWTLGTTAGSNTLTATSGTLTGSPLTFTATGTPGAATQLAIVTQPVGGTSGSALTTQPVVQIRDQYGNLVDDDATEVTVAILSGSGGTLGGTLTVTASGGVATFSGVTLAGTVAEDYVLRFTSDPVLTAADSDNVNVSAGAATTIAKYDAGNTDNQSATVGTAVTNDPAVIVTDANGNPVAGVAVSFAVASGGGTVDPVTSVNTNAQGIATVTSWTLGTTAGSNTLTATSGTLTGSPLTFTATGTPGAATQLAIVTQPVGGTSGSALTTQPVVQIRDQYGNLVDDDATEVTVAILSGSGGTLGGTLTVTASGGVATFSGVTLAGTVAEDYVLRFTSDPVLTAADSDNVNVSAGAATTIAKYDAGNTDNQSATVGTAVTNDPAVIVTDANGNPVAGVAVSFAVASGGGTVDPVTSVNTNAQGIATVTSWTLGTTAGSNTLTATSGTLTGSPLTFTATGTPGAATQLAIVTQPVGGTSGSALTTQPVVQIRDQYGNLVDDDATEVTVAILSGSGGTLGGTLTVTASGGVATFSGVTLAGTVAEDYVLRFTSDPVLTAADSDNVNVSAGAATTIAKYDAGNTDNQSATVGTAVTNDPAVIVTDANGNPVAGVAVSFAVASGGGTVDPVTSVNTNAQGIATVTSWTLGTTAGSNTLTATSGTLTGSPLTFTATGTPGAATQLAIVTQPVGGTSGSALTTQPVVQIRDQYGNLVDDDATEVTVAILSGSGGTLGGTLTVTASGGVATFSGVTLAGTVAEDYVLRFTSDPVLTAADSDNVNVSAGAATTIAKYDAGNTDNQSATVGTAVTNDPAVIVTDANGNPVAGVAVSFAVASGGGTVDPVTSVNTNAQGIATVTSWTLGTTAGSNTLTATSGTLTGSPLTFTATGTPGAATQLAIVTQPVGGTSGSALTTQPVVQIRDQYGNLVDDDATEVTVAILSGSGGTLGGTLTVTASGGVATFSGVTLAGTVAEDYVLRFTSDPVLTAADSDNVNVSAGAATTIAKYDAGNTDNQSATVGTAVTNDPAVIVTDANGNPVAGVAVSFAVASGGGTVDPVTSVNTNAQGIATVTSWTLGTTAGSNTLTATSGTLTGSPLTFTATGTPGAATQLAIVTQPVGGTSGSALTTQPVVQIRDQYGNLVDDDATEVTVAILSGSGGTLGGTLTVTASGGVATFSGVTLAGTVAEDYVLRFTSDPVLTAADSDNVNVSAGAATTIAKYDAGNTDNQSATVGTAVTNDPAVIVTDANGNPVAGVAVSFAVASGGGTVDPVTSVNTNAQGIATVTSWTLGTTAGSNTLTATSGTLTGSPLTFTATGTPGAATQLAIVTQPVGGTSGSALTTQPVVQIRDQYGNLVDDDATEVTVAILSGSGGTLGGTLTVTASGGVATFSGVTLAGTVAEDYVLRFTSDPVLTAADSDNVNVSAGAATTIAKYDAGNTDNQSATVGTAVTNDPAVIVTDANGNPVAGVAVSFAVASGGGTVDPVTSVNTNAQGIATVTSWTLGTTAGSNTLTATSGTLTGSPLTFTATGTPGAATQLAIVTQPVGGTSGSALTTQPVVQIRDQYGNLVDDDATEVTVAILSGSGGTLGGTLTVTASGGVATFSGVTLAGTVAEDYVLRFTSDPVLTAADSDNVNVSAGAATTIAKYDAGNTDNQSATVGTAVTNDPAVIVTDANGNPVAGVAVSFAVASGGGTVDPVTSVNTNAQGIATVTSWTLGTTAGSNTLTATSGTLTGSPLTFTATGTPGAATQLAIVTQPVGGTSGSALTTQPVVQIRDQYGNLVDDDATEVTVAILSGSGGTLGGTLTVTASGGVATFSGVTLAGTVAEDYVLRFTSDPVLTAADSDNVNVSAGAISASESIVSASPTSLTVVDESTLTITLKDANGNVISGIDESEFNVSLTGDAEVKANSFVEVGLGVYTFIIVNETAEEVTATVTVSTIELDDNPTIDYLHGPISASVSTVTASPASLQAGGESTVTVTLMDAFENRIAGLPSTDFAFTLSGDASLVPNSFTEMGNGVYTIKVTNTTAEQVTVTVTATGTELDTNPTITFSVSDISASESTVTADPTSFMAGGSTTITITLRDENGNLIEGVDLGEFSIVPGGDGSVVPNSLVEVGNGVYTVQITGTKTEVIDVTVTVDGIELADKPSVTITPAAISATESSVTVDPTNVGLGGESTVTITLKDAYGNVIEGLDLNELSIVLSGDATIVPNSLTEIGEGVYTAIVTNDTAETITVTVTADAVELDDAPSITFEANPIVSVVEPDGVTISDGAMDVTIDAPSQFVAELAANKPVTWTITGGANQDLFEISSTGEVSFKESSTTSATPYVVVVTATDAFGNTSNTTINITVVLPDFIVDVPNGTVYEETTVTITILDDEGNPILNLKDKLLVSMSGDNEDEELSEIIDNGDGTYTITYTPKVVGTDTFTITLDGEEVPGGPFVSNIGPGPASAANTTATVPGGLAGVSTTVTITVRDAYDNLLTGQASNLNLAVTSGPNTGTVFSSVTDNGDGTYTVSYTPTQAGTDQVNITLGGNPISGSPYSSVVTTGAISAANSTVTVNPSTLAVGGTSTVTITVRDVSNNPVSGLTSDELSVALSGGATIVPGSFVSVGNGVYTVGVTNDEIEQNTVTVTARGVVLDDNPVITFSIGAPVAANSTATVPGGLAGQPTTIVITLRDQFNNPVPGAADQLSLLVSGANTGAPFTAIIDNGDGTYTVSYTPTQAGTDQVNITLGGNPISGSPYNSTVIGQLALGSVNLPAWTENEPGYTAQLSVSGGAGPYNWSVIGERQLPPGLSLDPVTGEITGTPTLPGSFTFTIQVVDENGTTIDREYTIIIREAEIELIYSLVFTQSPNPVTEAGNQIGTIIVELQDQFGAPNPDFNGSVSIFITEGTGGASAQDAELIGVTEVFASNGVAIFTDIIMIRAGVNYTLTASSQNLPDGISEPFRVTPGPPWSLVIQELAEVDVDQFGNPVKAGSSDLASTHNLEGNRIPMIMTVYDEFGNRTVVPEGDTPVLLVTTSTTGNFYRDQTETTPVTFITIPVGEPSAIFFYEDPTPGELVIEGTPTPPPGARDISPGDAPLVIRMPASLRSLPEAYTTEIFKVEPVILSLRSSDNIAVRAPNPGVVVSLESSSATGVFYSDAAGTIPITQTTILPAESSVRVFYADITLGTHTLTFTGIGIPNPTDITLVTIKHGPAVATNTQVVVPDGAVGEETIIVLSLYDELGNPVYDGIDQILMGITEGPNEGADFTIVDNGDGTYTITYTPEVPGTDLIDIVINGTPMPASPFPSTVRATEPAQLVKISGDQQTVSVLGTAQNPFVVSVLDRFDAPVGGASVHFEIVTSPQGAQRMELASAWMSSTDEGLAQSLFSAGTRVGAYEVKAYVDGLEPVFFTVHVVPCIPVFGSDDPCGPYSYVVTSNNYTPDVNGTVAVLAQLTDQFGNATPHAGVEVAWTTNNAGSFNAVTSITNNSGVATISYTVNHIVGSIHTVTVTDAHNQRGTSPDIIPQGGGLAFVKVVGPDSLKVGHTGGPFELILYDEYHNEIVANRNLSFQIAIDEAMNVEVFVQGESSNLSRAGGNIITVQRQASRSRFHLRQNRTGMKSIKAQVLDDAEIPETTKNVLFYNETIDAHVLTLIAGQGQRERILNQLAERLTVTVIDQYENPIPNMQITFTLTATPQGATRMSMTNSVLAVSKEAAGISSLTYEDVIPVTMTTDSLGRAGVVFHLGDKAGQYTVMASGEGLNTVEFLITALPGQYTLFQNYPNPFNAGTKIMYEVPVDSDVTITLYNAIGQRVATLVQENRATGVYIIDLDMNRLGLTSGVYIYHMSAYGFETGSQYVKTQKLLYVK
jgi:hypothetical protein